MTPGARVQAAIEVLDAWLGGVPAEKALLKWARASRFAGSKDRAAVRDHVFQALRCLRSYSALGGGDAAPTGRALMLGAFRDAGEDPETAFHGQGHAPAPLSAGEAAAGRAPKAGAEAADMPDWLWPHLQSQYGAAAAKEAALLRARAPVFARVNLRKTTREEAAEALAAEGIEAVPSELAATALRLGEGARKLRQGEFFQAGRVELQDAASQAVVEALPLGGAGRVLDYCAGGGGKALALAALSDAQVFAHDIAPERMRDIPDRAARAGVQITQVSSADLAKAARFDLVLCDAPCSGSGAWRRSPEGKWGLSAARLAELQEMQLSVLISAAPHVAEDGVLAYVTCSLLAQENEETVQRFLDAQPGWARISEKFWCPSDGADGFYLAALRRL